MTAVLKKEPDSDLYESEERNSQGNYTFVPETSNRGGFDRARWSENDMLLLFRWFDDPENLRRYNHGIKVKAIRALAETIPGKTDRQVQNKMTALENHYNQCKAKLKQGIPLTERDMESGITTAPAKVKSIFRYYYELDHILNGSSASGINYNSGRNETNDYDSSPRHHRGQRMSYDSPAQSYPHNGHTGDKPYKYSSYVPSQRTHPSEQRDAVPNSSVLQEDNSPNSSNSHIQPSSDRAPKHSSAPAYSTHLLPSRISDHINGTSAVPDSAEHNSFKVKPAYSPNSEARVIHSSYRKTSRKDRLLSLEEEKLSFKRKRHAETIELANRQLEAEEKWRRQMHEDIQEDLQLRRLELQLRRDELNLLQQKPNQEPTQTFSGEQTPVKTPHVGSPAKITEKVSNGNIDTLTVVQES